MFLANKILSERIKQQKGIWFSLYKKSKNVSCWIENFPVFAVVLMSGKLVSHDYSGIIHCKWLHNY